MDFKNGMKVIKNSEMSDDKIYDKCDEWSTNRDLIDRIIAGEVFTIEEYDYPHTKVREYEGEAPWIPVEVFQMYNDKLEGVEEL